MVEFKKKADAIIKQRYGIEVEHHVAKRAGGVSAEKVTYEKAFHKEMTKGKHIGAIKGFPMLKGNWCTQLKLCAFPKYEKGSVEYIGIAVDEPNRFRNLTYSKRSPLVEAGWTEAMCRKWCEENNLLSPIYTDSARGGCWFCHNQGVGQLRFLRKNYPDLWRLLMKWDLESPVSFKPNGLTVHDYDRRFQMEDDGLIPVDGQFRWDMLINPPGTQISLFQEDA